MVLSIVCEKIRYFNVLLSLACLLGWTQVCFAKSGEKSATIYTTRQILKDYFSKSKKVTYFKLSPDATQRNRLSERLGWRLADRSWTFYRATTHGQLDGFGYVGRSRGRTETFRYAIKLDPVGTIQRLEIIEYRSPQGAEILQARFRNQFIGKKATDRLHVGDDIDAISGATINANSLTQDVRQTLIVFDELVLNQKEGKIK